MAPAKVQEIVDTFQERKGSRWDLACDILISTITNLGTGYTLTRAKKLIVVDVDYLEAATLQALIRIYRISQLNKTESWILTCSKVEVDRRMNESQQKRGDLMKEADRTEQAKQSKKTADVMSYFGPGLRHLNIYAWTSEPFSVVHGLEELYYRRLTKDGVMWLSEQLRSVASTLKRLSVHIFSTSQEDYER